MGKRNIDARARLWELLFDLKRMLEENQDTKKIKEIIKTRIDKLQDGKHHKIIWN